MEGGKKRGRGGRKRGRGGSRGGWEEGGERKRREEERKRREEGRVGGGRKRGRGGRRGGRGGRRGGWEEIQLLKLQLHVMSFTANIDRPRVRSELGKNRRRKKCLSEKQELNLLGN